MQDRFVGDIADFAQYGLLQVLFGSPDNRLEAQPKRLAVVWYLNSPTEKESNKSAGSDIRYLKVNAANCSKYRICNPHLYDRLRCLVGSSLIKGNPLSVAQIPCSGILLSETDYFMIPLPKNELIVRNGLIRHSIQLGKPT